MGDDSGRRESIRTEIAVACGSMVDVSLSDSFIIFWERDAAFIHLFDGKFLRINN